MESEEHFLEEGFKKSEIEAGQEIFSGNKPEKTGEKTAQERPEEIEQKIKKLKQGIGRAVDEKKLTPEPLEDAQQRIGKVKAYQDKYLPDYLCDRKKGIIGEAITYFWTRGLKFEIEGRENLPEKGPFLVVCNHFGLEGDALAKTFKDYDLHLVVAKEVWWNSNPVIRWVLKKLKTIPIEESLANISEEDKEASLKRQGKEGKRAFRKIIDREKQGGTAMNAEFVRQAVAALSRGDTVGIFPEGLWLNPELPKIREKQEMKQGYRGIELVAGQYKKLTGEELSIIPTAFVEDRATGKKKLVIKDPVRLSENDSRLNDTDWCMAHVAGMLPESQRGYYKETAIER